MGGRRKEAQKFIAENRGALFHYDVAERYEAGIVLRGSEVKSLREGRVQLTEAYASVEKGEVWLRQLHIASFFAARAFPHAERGARKLLLHAREIRRLDRALSCEGYTLVPLNLYFKDGWVKVTLGLARGKKMHDKRAAIAERTAARELAGCCKTPCRSRGSDFALDGGIATEGREGEGRAAVFPKTRVR